MTTKHRYSLFFLGIAPMTMIAIGLTGCGTKNDADEPVASMGQPLEDSSPQREAASIDDHAIGKTIAIEGEIVKQCPAVGCWFIVKDESGEVFVDLNPAGLRLKQKREGGRARVTGRVTKKGGQYRLEAQHVQFETKKEAAPTNQK